MAGGYRLSFVVCRAGIAAASPPLNESIPQLVSKKITTKRKESKNTAIELKQWFILRYFFMLDFCFNTPTNEETSSRFLSLKWDLTFGQIKKYSIIQYNKLNVISLLIYT